MSYWIMGVTNPKYEINVGNIFRSAHAFGASGIFTLGHRKYVRQATDTSAASRSIPLWRFLDIEDLIQHLPHGCPIVGIELAIGGTDLTKFNHPRQACYMLGAEDGGIPKNILQKCHYTIEIPETKYCLNVANAAAIIMYDRIMKRRLDIQR